MTLVTLKQEDLRAIRKLFARQCELNYRPRTVLPLRYGGYYFLAWKNVPHASSQIYLQALQRIGDTIEASDWMITQKCELKRMGNSRAKPEMIEHWRKHFGGEIEL